MSREVWLPVVGYDRFYEVSNLGRVRRALDAEPTPGTSPGRAVKPVMTSRYMVVSLSKLGVVESHRLHILVLTAFCGPPPFAGAQGCHNDGDTRRNDLANLRWGSALQNQADVDRHGNRCRGTAVHGAVLDEGMVAQIRCRISAGERNPAIAADYGVSISTIHLIRHDRIWRHVA